MKTIISTKGLTEGHFDAPWLSAAIHERVDNKLLYSYKQECGDDIEVVPKLSYELKGGHVSAIELAYTIADPTPQRLEFFREACENFFELHGFTTDSGDHASRVYFRATDLFDMASLIHALDFQSVSFETVVCAVDDSLTEKDAIYSPSGNYIIQIPDVPHYSIKEGTLFISPMAARHCAKLQQIDIPVGMIFDDSSLPEYPQGLKVKVWDTHYDGTPFEDLEDIEFDEQYMIDGHGVGYSKDGKVLLFCQHIFNETWYEVPDGVEEIADYAFTSSRHYLELYIPRSVKTIGDNIFGNGGVIVIKDSKGEGL